MSSSSESLWGVLMNVRLRSLLVVACLASGVAWGAVVGTSTAAESISAERIRQMPAGERAAWMAYLERSNAQRAADKAALAAERKGLAAVPELPKEGAGLRLTPLDREAAFYASEDARRTADVIVSFQTPAGGWGKNMAYNEGVRKPGQAYVPNNLSHFLDANDFDRPKEPEWNYVGTLDNDATSTQLKFLARVQAAAPGVEGATYRASFVRGIEYLLKAQFPNGGWPQVWPLEGGYHDAITFNDNAVTQAAEVLSSVAEGKGDYGFVAPPLRQRAGKAARAAVGIVLRAQVVVDGRKTVWAQQHDALTLKPVAGRNYEPAALSSGESAHLLVYLMAIEQPTPEVRTAVEAGVAWLRETAIRGFEWSGGRATPGGRKLVAKEGAGPMWARYYSFRTGKPIFGDRDRTIHDDVAELSLERRNGYAWFSAGPEEALKRYESWKAGGK
jgi:PelA/Pel-15E family pectate lyase